MWPSSYKNQIAALKALAILALSAAHQSINAIPMYYSHYVHDTLGKTVFLIADKHLNGDSNTDAGVAKTVALLNIIKAFDVQQKKANTSINFYYEYHAATTAGIAGFSLEKAIKLAPILRDHDTMHIIKALDKNLVSGINFIGIDSRSHKSGELYAAIDCSEDFEEGLIVGSMPPNYSYLDFLSDVELAIERFGKMGLDAIASRKLNMMRMWLTQELLLSRNATWEEMLSSGAAIWHTVHTIRNNYILPVIDIPAYHAITTDKNPLVFGYFGASHVENIGAMLKKAGYRKVAHVSF